MQQTLRRICRWRVRKSFSRRPMAGNLPGVSLVWSMGHLYFAELCKEDKLQWRVMRTMDRRPVHCPTRKEYVFSPEVFREDLEARLCHPCSSLLVEPPRVIELQPHAAMDEVTDIAAAREWAAIPAELKRVMLSSAFCRNCGVASSAPGYSLRMGEGGVVVVGNCSVCGA